MPNRWPMNAWLPLLLLAGGALVATCGAPGPAVDDAVGAIGDPETLLPGTWLRESSAEGVAARHVLALGPDHHFREAVRVTDATGNSSRHVHEGTWLYDGINLKRKYTAMDGRPPSRLNLPFATFQITFESPRAFRGVDHIHGNQIEYHRVADDTEP